MPQLRRWPGVHATVLAAVVAAWCLLVPSLPFWERLLEVRPLQSAADLGRFITFGAFAGAIVYLFLLPLVLVRRLAAPLLALVLVVSALASHFMQAYGVLIDKVMIRNVFATDPVEAGELVNLRLLVNVGLLGVLPAIAVLGAPVVRPGWRRGLLRWLGAAVVALAAILLVAALYYKDHAALVRGHRELRHLLVPVNLMSALGSHLRDSTRARMPYERVGEDVRPRRSWQGGSGARAKVVVLVVGETARAANFSLDGYGRETNPQLAAIRGLVNFPDVTACGTSTAISVPCMFSGLGRSGFSPERARNRDNLLDIAARAGFEVRWYGNNTDCKGLCRVAPQRRPDRLAYPDLCVADRPCLDGAMFRDFEREFPTLGPRSLVVLHMLGSHGPGYHLRYPDSFSRFEPACRNTDFSKCSREELLNAYDNTLLYSDALLAGVIRFLEARAADVDSALLFVSDHGESLGERGLFLHAVPYAIAPSEQLKVPMVFWASAGFTARLGLDSGCLQQRRTASLSHDNLFHSALGLLDLETAARDPRLDLFGSCRGLR